ncbi:MAG TPA: peptidase S9, partial [Thermoanaerobaculia bacterium]
MRLSFRLSAVLLLLLVVTPSNAQYFGKNKVQWEAFDFKTLHTEHFDIYYYDKQKDVVDDIGRMAERWYQRLSVVFQHEFRKKPIVLYANSADFRQTTTTPGFIGEGTGGFTDAFQNRIVFPLTGNRSEDDHVLGHEMVHVFQYEMASRMSRGGNQGAFALQQLPLWLIEGMAEYLSKGRIDPLTAMWIRDATINDRLPDLRKLTRDPRYFPYRYGQAILAYVGARYGDDQVVRLFLAAGTEGLEQAFPSVLGVSAKDVFNEWHESARTLYQPVIAARPTTLGEPLIGDRKRMRGELNIAPSISPDGRYIAFLSARELFSIDLFLAEASTGKVIRKLLSEDADPHIDSVRFIDSAGSWSPDSKKLAFIVTEKGDNRIAILDVDSRNVDQRISIPGVDAITNPVWSPDGQQIAFSGQPTGVSDIFVYDLRTGQAR